MRDTDSRLIETLVGQLESVRPIKWRHGALLTLAALGATIFVVVLLMGRRDQLLIGEFSALFVITQGLLLVLGASAASAVVAMANPQVGASHDGPKWALATVALLPLTAIVTAVAQGAGPAYPAMEDLHCAAAGCAFSGLIAVTLFLWLRRGAPVLLEKAGFNLGVAAGSLGVFAHGLSCPLETMTHLGIWHVLPVVVTALLGRLVVPRLLRW
ncbi:MAG TPA: DUF1109 domain-containing protein [Sphingomonadaceae bacterium]|nr:DUF1109 domain-containing protein [Sphingomonadaceae bacterium]